MWIFTKDGFLSIVKDRDRPRCLLVRARIKGDIERFFPGAKVERTEDRDYLYRASIPIPTVDAAISEEIASIDYFNFKNAVADTNRIGTYVYIWEAMADLQDRLRSAA